MIADAFRWGTFVDAFAFIGDHPGFLLQKAAEPLPLGVALGHLHRGSFLALAAGNIGRALPSLVLIGVFLTVLGIGFVNNMVALVVLAVAPLLTNAYAAVDGVDPAAVQAARGMGLTEAQILRQVELPL